MSASFFGLYLYSHPKSFGRTAQPHLWQRNVRKRLRQSGQAYVGVSGEVRRPRQLHSQCSPRCSRGCSSKFTLDQLRAIHDNFWTLNDAQKDEYYALFTERKRPARVRTKVSVSRKVFTYLYYLSLVDDEHQRHQVCLEFFISTLDISKARVYHFFASHKSLESEEPWVPYSLFWTNIKSGCWYSLNLNTTYLQYVQKKSINICNTFNNKMKWFLKTFSLLFNNRNKSMRYSK